MTIQFNKKKAYRLFSIRFFLLILIFLLLFLLDVNTGSIKISLSDFLETLLTNSNEKLKWILVNIRIPRATTAVLSGISLPLSGLLLQTVFSNPLAGPYILGISSGASFGVALLLLGTGLLGITALAGSLSIIIASFAGAMLVLLIILSISIKKYNNSTILIAGIFLGSGISAIVSLMQYFAPAISLKKYVIWTMGSLDAVTKTDLPLILMAILLSAVLILFLSKYLDALYLGEETAKSSGVNVKRLKISIFVLTGVMTGVITAYCGPIGFVGIAVPHIARFFSKTSRHLHLIVYSAIIGAIIMLGADILAHSFTSKVIPINTLTAIIGIPVIFAIILQRKFMSN